MAVGENPCRHCTDRQVGCHAVCERYLNWEQEHKADKERIRSEKHIEYTGYVIDSNQRRKKQKKKGGYNK